MVREKKAGPPSRRPKQVGDVVRAELARLLQGGPARPGDRVRDDHGRRHGRRPALGPRPRLRLRGEGPVRQDRRGPQSRARAPARARRDATAACATRRTSTSSRTTRSSAARASRSSSARSRRPTAPTTPARPNDARRRARRRVRRRRGPAPERDAASSSPATAIPTATPSAPRSASRRRSRRPARKRASSCATRWSYAYDGMPGISRVEVLDALPADWPAAYDAILVMECPESDRTGWPNLFAGTVVNVDHHPGNARYGALNLIDLPAAAVGEIVADLLDLLQWPIAAGHRDEPLGLARLGHGLVPLFEHDAEGARARRAARRGGRAAGAGERVPLRGRAAVLAEARGARPRNAGAPRGRRRRHRRAPPPLLRRERSAGVRHRGPREPRPRNPRREGRRAPARRRRGRDPLLAAQQGNASTSAASPRSTAAAATATPPAAG